MAARGQAGVTSRGATRRRGARGRDADLRRHQRVVRQTPVGERARHAQEVVVVVSGVARSEEPLANASA